MVKKILILGITLCMLCSLAGCMQKDNTLPICYYQCPQCHESRCTCQDVSFSLDNGINWYTSNNRLIEFDIWDVKSNEEVPGMVFIYATSYEQLFEEIEKNKDYFMWDELLDIYNEEYFENHILLLYYKFEPNYSENYVYNVIIKDDSLTLIINRFEGEDTVLSDWYQYATIKKTDLENINKFNVVVRTVSKLVSSIRLSANDEYIRYIYINGLSTFDFPGLNNLKSVDVSTWSIMIDIIFNETVTNDRLDDIVSILKTSENIKSVGYTSNTWIRVTLNNKFFDKYIDKTLTLDDVLDYKIENSNNFTMDIKNFTPLATITLEMEKHGRQYYETMIKQLKELKYPFINYKDLN